MDHRIINSATIDLIMFAELEMNSIIFTHMMEIEFLVNKDDLSIDDIILFLENN